MTDQQKQRIIDLRAEGKPYKEIAEKLGLSLGCVKMFMSRRKREGERRKCEMCGKYLPKVILRPARRFCSDRCRVKWWAVHPDRMGSKRSFVCETCGKDFFSRKTRKFCSRLCYYKSMKHVG